MLEIGAKRRNTAICCIYHKQHICGGHRGRGEDVTRADLLANMGTAIAAIGTAEAFPPAMADALRIVAPYTYTVIFAYHGNERPLDLFDDFPGSKRRVFVADYQEGPYLLDPFYLAATRPVSPGLYRLRDFAPDRFYQGEYFRSYYEKTGLAEEIGFFVELTGGVMVVLSLMREDRVFSSREFRALDAFRPVVDACLRRHWASLPARFAPPRRASDSPPKNRIERSFQTFAEGQLTPREREIVEYTLKGHSAEAMGRILGIAPGTVRIHRRNIYAKLRISSQGELFSNFIQTMGAA